MKSIKLNNDRTVINKITFSYDLSVMKTETPNETLIHLAKRVKELRVERNLTQEDAFNDTGIHFGRIEQGKEIFLLQHLKNFAIISKSHWKNL